MREVLVSFKEAILPLMAPVIIIGGIFSGIFTPTEASVIACIYALILGFAYRDLKLKDLPEILWKSIKQSTPPLHHGGGQLLRLAHAVPEIPDSIIGGLASMSVSGSGVLWMIIIVDLILGCFLEGNSIFLITIPIFFPIALQYA